MVMKTKKLLIIGFLLVSLISVLLWLFGLRIEHVRILILFFSEPLKLSAEETTELHTWLKENAVHLNSIEAGSGFDDMQPLKAIIGDARIVALGEAAHLNRDFSRVKHRIVEFLVNEMDFTVFAIEATFAGALELNDYILTGNGDPKRALGALVYPAWTTEAILDMVNWMREYNATHKKKVKFYGFDNKPATGSAKAVYNYLRKTNGTRDYDQVLSVMMNTWTANQLNKGPKEEIRRVTEKIKSLIAHLENQQPATTKKIPSAQVIQDQKEWSLAVQHARVLLQHIKFYGVLPSISKATDLRDKNMAQNVRWLVDYEDGAKMILWAANVHILTMPGSGCMGDYLRRTYGDDMVVIGLLSNRKFSESPENSDETPLTRDGTLQATLAQAGLDIAVVDFRSLPKGIVSRYFNSPIRAGGVETIYPLSYDAILFIESTTNARLVRADILGRTVTLQSPSNLDFEELQDGKPKDWKSQGGQSRLEYQTTGSHDQPYRGSTCGMIKRIPGRPFGEPFGNIRQSIKASGYRAKEIRLSAASRVSGGVGYLWISINVPGSPGIFHQEIITSDKWQEYHIVAEVPQKASKITYGLAYAGQGAAFIDDVAIGNSN